MPVTATVIAGGAGILGGVIGNMASAGDRKRAMAAIEGAMNELRGVQIPDIEKQKIVLAKLTQQGIITPVQEQEILQQSSAFEQLKEDAGLREAQTDSLGALRKIAQKGLTPEDKAELNQVRAQLARDAQARDQSVIQNMQQRGVAGGGSELAQRLLASQSQADRAASEGDRISAMAFRNKLDAIRQSGALAGDVRSSDYRASSDKASAADRIAAFNTQNRIGTQQRNVAGQNEANLYNLREKQRIADQNIDLTNRQEVHNKGLYQQRFENEMRRAQAIANAASGVAQQYNNQANATAAMWAGIGGGAGQMGGAFAQSGNRPSSTQASSNSSTIPMTASTYDPNSIYRA